MVIEDEALKKVNEINRKIEADRKLQRRQTSIEKLPEDMLSSSYKGKKSTGKDRYSV